MSTKLETMKYLYTQIATIPTLVQSLWNPDLNHWVISLMRLFAFRSFIQLVSQSFIQQTAKHLWGVQCLVNFIFILLLTNFVKHRSDYKAFIGFQLSEVTRMWPAK